MAKIIIELDEETNNELYRLKKEWNMTRKADIITRILKEKLTKKEEQI
jgi:hypothetical protein